MNMESMNAFVNSPVQAPKNSGQNSSTDKSSVKAEDFSKLLSDINKQTVAAAKEPNVAQTAQQQTGLRILTENGTSLDISALQNAAIDDSKPDGTLMELLNQLFGMLQNTENEVDLDALIGQMQKRLREIAEENGGKMAGEMFMNIAQQFLAELSVLNAGGVELSPEKQKIIAQAWAGLSAEGEAIAPEIKDFAIKIMQALKPEKTAELQQKPQTMQAAQKTQFVQPAQEAKPAQETKPIQEARPAQEAKPIQEARPAQEAKPTQEKQLIKEVQVIYQKEPVKAENAQPQKLFEDAVRLVKVKLAESGVSVTTVETDVDDLQKQVDTGAYLKNTALSAPIDIVAQQVKEAPPLTAQIENGILNGLKTGQNELVLKLRPEGLGELTIRLNRSAEGTIVSIIAKNNETQRLLASEAHLLKESLKPYKVAVDSILTEQQESLLSGQQNFEQQHGNNWRDWQNPSGQNGQKNKAIITKNPDQLEEIATIKAQNFASENLLNTYI